MVADYKHRLLSIVRVKHTLTLSDQLYTILMLKSHPYSPAFLKISIAMHML